MVGADITVDVVVLAVDGTVDVGSVRLRMIFSIQASCSGVNNGAETCDSSCGAGSSDEVDPVAAVVGGNVISSAGTVCLGLRRYLVDMASLFRGLEAVPFTSHTHSC